MPHFDLANEYQVGASLEPNTYTVDTNGDAVDFQDCEAAVTSILTVGESQGTSETTDLKLQESDDLSTWSDISSATHTQVGASGHSTEIKTFFNRSKRYVRAHFNVSGTSPDVELACVLMCRKKSY